MSFCEATTSQLPFLFSAIMVIMPVAWLARSAVYVLIARYLPAPVNNGDVRPQKSYRRLKRSRN
jgi:hypothetical protein